MIKFIYYFYFSLKDVFSHKMRAALSILGVVFGIAAVISMVSISQGAKRDVINQINLLGVDNMSVISKQGGGGDYENRAPLVYSDFESIVRLEFVEMASPVKITPAEATHEDRSLRSEVFAVNEHYGDILSLTVSNGRFFDKDDVVSIRKVCVIGSAVKKSLFGLKSAIGELIRINSDWYSVIGVAAERRKVRNMGAISFKNIDGAIFLPVSSFYESYFTLFEKPLDEIAVKVSTEYDKKRASQRISALLLEKNKERGFDIIIPSELIAQSYNTQRVFNIVLAIIAAISLVVGGIGIMNIMLANVTERTREIGVRRAIGAKKSDIMLQFVLESLILTSLGGIAGVVLGIAAASFINYTVGWTVYISPAGVVFSLLTASFTGMVFGIYPAAKASLLNPIEALRYE